MRVEMAGMRTKKNGSLVFTIAVSIPYLSLTQVFHRLLKISILEPY